LGQTVREHATGVTGGLAAGVGRLYTGLDDYVDSYAEAALDLDLARRRRATGVVLTSRDLGLYSLLGRGSTRQTMQEMVERVLGPLLAADAEGGPEYVKTMHAYVTNDRHLERSAAALHVHPNTVRYRIGRVQELCQVNLRDPDDRFLLELALRVQVALQEG
ncbi:MAG: helix-turn-helix domain-containing protein, partial [Actinomycetia bacterium]|nr:helix-turn-helix domain-containing protein [Actinomycetes bacterium]